MTARAKPNRLGSQDGQFARLFERECRSREPEEAVGTTIRTKIDSLADRPSTNIGFGAVKLSGPVGLNVEKSSKSSDID